MERLSQGSIVIFSFKYFISTFYVIPIWFISVYIFEKYLLATPSILPVTQIIWILNGAGIIFAMGLIVGCYYLAWYTYERFSYTLQSDGLHIDKGLLFRTHIHVPFQEVENIQIALNPFLVQTLGLYSLRIITRQLESSEGIFKKSQTVVLPGLAQEKAQKLRTELLKGIYSVPTKKSYFDPTSGQYITHS